jgi:Winged helix-turn helix
MPALAVVVLTDDERRVLERWARRPKSAHALALRCRIVLAAAQGEQSKAIAAQLGCAKSTVGKWRGRFARHGLDGLHDEPRPGKPRSIGDEEIERAIVKTLEESPPRPPRSSAGCFATRALSGTSRPPTAPG